MRVVPVMSSSCVGGYDIQTPAGWSGVTGPGGRAGRLDQNRVAEHVSWGHDLLHDDAALPPAGVVHAPRAQPPRRGGDTDRAERLGLTRPAGARSHERPAPADP